MKVIVRLSSCILAFVACAAMGGCVVASGADGSNGSDQTLREDLAHVGPNGNPEANTATPPTVGEQTIAPDFGSLAAPHAPTSAPSPTKPKGTDIGFSTNTPDDPGGAHGDGPRPHPWIPGPTENAPSPEDNSKPSIGGAHDDGTKPNK